VAAITLIAVVFINMTGFGIVVPLLPFYAQSFEAQPWEIALIFSAYSMGSFFGEPFWGRLSDRIGRKPVLVWTIAGNFLCYFALAFAPNVLMAFLIRFAGGMASGNGSVIQAYVADVTPLEKRAGQMAVMAAVWNLGFIIGPAVGGLLARPDAGHLGFQIPLLAASGLSLICAICVAIFVKESRAGDNRLSAQPSRWAVFSQATRHPVISRLMLVTLLVGCAFTGIEATFALWAQQRFTWGPREIGLCFAAMGVAAAFVEMFLLGRLTERFGVGRTLAFGMGLMMVSAAATPLAQNAWQTVALMCLIGVGMSFAWPNVATLITAHTASDTQGQTLGLNNAASALARFLGPLAAGLAFAEVSLHAPFVMAALIQVAAVAVVVRANRLAAHRNVALR
jgi:DHA1 family tetracycline resistance protein-like MFS transporter